ncbi:hypothetical protein CHU92_03650 [Flavobacterium cyanobacteriorum]|uniref:Phosphatidic acid phosphatase type 2/haloperoxidase domain-containing protein n=2 Tax=Flavobacterium cyanobacteriorum TaxID=2022802 RepID=A0A255ZP27_9FLAO|nr:hypothetical protein CHU92_03650 [Flavobacterium cyanobacteriorum]
MVIPVIVLILYAVYKSRGWHLILVVSFVFILGVAILFNMTDFLETGFQRLRPGNNPEIAHFIRTVQKRSSYSFISGHASNSMACAYFLFRVLRPYLKYMGFIFIWPLVFAYSRIYLGLHYPGDILMGYVWGLITASLMLLLYRYLRDKWFPEKEALDHPTNSEPISDR